MNTRDIIQNNLNTIYAIIGLQIRHGGVGIACATGTEVLSHSKILRGNEDDRRGFCLIHWR